MKKGELIAMKNISRRIKEAQNEITLFDWILFFAFALFFFFSTNQGDIIHTGSASYGLLKGHVLTFYEYVGKHLGGCSYLLSTYIMFAIWNIPLAILGLTGDPSMSQPYGVLMWYKALPTLIFLLSGVIIYKIGKKFEKDTGINAKWGIYIFLTTSVAFYSQFMFGQYDVFTVFFMLLGIYQLFCHHKSSELLFSLFFGIATTFKYHALLFYVPILLYRNKKLFAIIKNMVLYCIPLIIVVVPYLKSSVFNSGVTGFGAIDYFFGTNINTYNGGQLYLVPLIWVGICAKVFISETKENEIELFSDINYYCGYIVWLSFGMVFWHPQWLMIAAPFFALSIITSERRDFICFIDIAIAYCYMAFVVAVYPGLTESFYELGAFKNAISIEKSVPSFTMTTVYPFTVDSGNVLFTVFSALLLTRAMLLKPKDAIINHEPNFRDSEKRWIKVRAYLGLGVIIVPAILCLISLFNAPYQNISVTVNQEKAIVELNMDTTIEYHDVYFVVWSNEDGQDDIIWHPANKSQKENGMSNWNLTIDLHEHKGTGLYWVHTYAGEEGNLKGISAKTFTVNALDK